MAKVEQRVYRNQYYQGTMSDDNAACILELLKEDVIPSLQHCIYNLEDFEVADIIAKREVDKSKFSLGTLRNEQTIGVAFMYFAKSCLLGDEVGLGKTVEVAGLCNIYELNYSKLGKPFRYCFLTESTSADQIRKKLVKFTGNYVELLPSAEQGVVKAFLSTYPNGDSPAVVGTHALLNNQDFALYCARHPFDLFIIDESSFLKNVSNTVYQNTKAILKYCENKVMLNATPLETAVRDFYNQLALLDVGYLPTVSEFERDYCKKTKVGHDLKISGTKNEALFRQVVKLRYLARTRKELGANYEGNSGAVYVIEPSEVQKTLMKRSSLYQMVADYPPDVDIRVPFDIKVVPKIRATLEILKGLDISKERVLIYCNFKNCQTALQKVLLEHGYKSAIINGDTKAKQRAEIIFNVTHGDTHILITNVKRGLDLNECSHCIMYTIDKNPGRLFQVEGRIIRDFDVKYRNLYLLVMKGREEQAILGVLNDRIKMVQDMTVVGSSLSMDAIQDQSNWKYVNYN